jgi:hypothetical protein
MQAEIIPASLHVSGREWNTQSLAQDAQVFEIDLFLKVFGACRDENTLATQNRRHQVRKCLAGSRSRLHEENAAMFESTRDSIRHLALGWSALESRQRSGERSRVRENTGDPIG